MLLIYDNMEITDFERIIIAAYRLPFKLVRKKEKYHAVQNAGGLVSAILSLSEKMDHAGKGSSKILWVGTGEKELGDENVNPYFELFPVEIPQGINEKYYGGFCNDTIWPLFHYFPSRTVYREDYFEAYEKANELFLKKLKEIIKPGDFVWIHDYQLFLLPGLVRQAFPESSIGFFLHTPFPDYEIFRLLPRSWREAVLRGMTGADVVGFHTNDYTQYFLRSVKRTLEYRIDRNFISVEGRVCKAEAFPIGIDYDKFHSACSANKSVSYRKKLKKQLGDKKIVFSIDRLDYSKGFLNRLAAIERFLENYPEWHGKVIFNMVVIPSRENIETYRKIKKEIEATEGRINGKYSNLSWRPVIYQYKSIPFDELVAIYNISDVALITPIRDGMNLVAKEYIACQTELPGMLILSEMAGAAVELYEAIIINPNDIGEMSEAIDKALRMPAAEKTRRIGKMQERLKSYNVFTWASDFFRQSAETKTLQESKKVIYLDEDILESIRADYINSQNRLFLMDYDGTLAPLKRLPKLALLNKRTSALLNKIVSDIRNTVVIISGRNRKFLEEQFDNINVIMVAEHGYCIKYPGGDWKDNLSIDLSWKKKVLPLLNDYTERLKGTLIEEKSSSLAWHFRDTEEENALQKVNELRDTLSEIIKDEPGLELLEGDKVLEVKSALYNKGTTATGIISQGKYDFILAIGDDNTDEYLFEAIPPNAISIKVGGKPTSAWYNIGSQALIYRLLSVFAESFEEVENKA
jgi:trehalose 6-phosphate synthase/phosphatase